MLFRSPGYAPPTPGPGDDPAAPASFIARTIKEMADDNDTVLYVDYEHLAAADYDLADRVLQHYERVEPLLCVTQQTAQDRVSGDRLRAVSAHVQRFSLATGDIQGRVGTLFHTRSRGQYGQIQINQ